MQQHSFYKTFAISQSGLYCTIHVCINACYLHKSKNSVLSFVSDVRVSAWLYFLLGWIVLMVILFLVLFYLYIKAKPNSKPSSYAVS